MDYWVLCGLACVLVVRADWVDSMSEKAIRFTVLGCCYSMKNSHTLTTRGGRVRSIKPLACTRFESDFTLQVPAEYRDLRLGSRTEPIRTIVTVFYPSWRQDLDLSVVYDLLQKNGIVTNDRWIREKHEFAEVDPKNPRVDLTVELI